MDIWAFPIFGKSGY